MNSHFEIKWLVQNPLLGESVLALQGIVSKYSSDSSRAWNFRSLDFRRADFSLRVAEQLILDKKCFWLDRSSEVGASSWVERIAVNTGIYAHYWPEDFIFMEIDGVKIDLHKAYDFFEDVTKLFEMPFLYYLPGFEGAWRGMSSLLDAALQRDYSWGALDPRFNKPQILLAESLAIVLPRLGVEYYPPDSKFPLFPQRLGWLNCWSAEVAEHLGFPDPQKDANILPLCKQLSSGHWIVQLTEDPLDLRRPEHAEAIVRAYWRFDKIGRRSKPAAKKKSVAKSKPAPVDPASLRTYVIHASDASGNWWQADYPPIEASSEDEALRIYFCKLSRSRMPRPHETLGRLRKAYDAVVLEVEGLPLSENVEARLAE